MDKNEEDELSFISRKIYSMWRRKRGMMFKGRNIGSSSKNKSKDRRLKDLIVY